MNRPRSERHALSCQQFRDDLWDMHMDRPLLAYVGHLQHCAGCKAWFEEQCAAMRQQYPAASELGAQLGVAVAGLFVAKWKEEAQGG